MGSWKGFRLFEANEYNLAMTFDDTKSIPDYYNNPDYLKAQQYHDAGNLNARIEIHKRFSTGEKDWNDFIFKNLPLKSNAKSLALGCGNAAQWRHNQSRFPQDLRMVLSDLSFGMLNEPRRAFKEDLRFFICVMDAQAIAFKKDSFDFVTANHMLYHVPDISCVLSEVARVLNEEGLLMAATNGGHHMTELDQLLERFDPVYQGDHAMSGRFTLENGGAQLAEYFKEVRMIPYKSDLWVTDAALLCDYAWSTPIVKTLFNLEQKSALQAFFQERINTDGGIFIAKETGLFIASKPRK